MAQIIKNLLHCGRPRFSPWIGIFPGERNGSLVQSSCLEKFHGQRSLVGYSPWGDKESDTTEWLTLSLSTLINFLNFLISKIVCMFLRICQYLLYSVIYSHYPSYYFLVFLTSVVITPVSYLFLVFSLVLSLGGGFPIQFSQSINSWFVDFYIFLLSIVSLV